MDEADLIALAAVGDIEAQSALVDAALLTAQRGVPVAEALCGAELIARMAASHGKVSDRMKLAGVLLLRAASLEQNGDEARRDVFHGEAVDVLDALASEGVAAAGAALLTILNGMADDGSEPAGTLLNSVVDRLGPAVVAEARKLQKDFGG